MTGIKVERPNSNKAYELFGGAASLSCGTDMDALFGGEGCVSLHKDPDPMPKLNTNQEDRANFCCHGNIVCPGDIALVTGASFTTTGEMKNSQFRQSAIIYEPPPTTRRHFCRLTSISPSLSHSSTHLMQTKPTRLSPCSLKETPNANLGKLFIVCRQLPPGVLVSQKALQMQQEISFLIFFIYFFEH